MVVARHRRNTGGRPVVMMRKLNTWDVNLWGNCGKLWWIYGKLWNSCFFSTKLLSNGKEYRVSRVWAWDLPVMHMEAHHVGASEKRGIQCIPCTGIWGIRFIDSHPCYELFFRYLFCLPAFAHGFPIWVCVNTYRYIFSGMNIHLPAILGFTRYQGFDPSPYLNEVP